MATDSKDQSEIVGPNKRESRSADRAYMPEFIEIGKDGRIIDKSKRKVGRPVGSKTMVDVLHHKATQKSLEILDSIVNDEPEKLIYRKNNSPGGGKRFNEHGLTDKQEKFARLVANGYPMMRAYRESYDVKSMSPDSIHTAAFKLKQNNCVAKRINGIIEDNDKKAKRDLSKVRDYVKNKLFDIVEAKDSRYSEKLKALELMGKIDQVGMWQNRTEITTVDNRSSQELAKELKDRLRRMLDENTIDITPIHDIDK